MNPLRSLRARVLFGSFLWTMGLLPIAHLVAILLVHRYPGIRVHHFAHGAALFVLALGFLACGLWQFRRSLSPFQALRSRLAAVRDGSAPRVEGRYPTEVQPLVDDLNALLEHREKMVERALKKVTINQPKERMLLPDGARRGGG